MIYTDNKEVLKNALAKIEELEALKIAHLTGNPLKEITTLRQQVERLQEVKIEYECRMKEMRKDAYDEAEALRQQVALRELEIVKLREALEEAITQVEEEQEGSTSLSASIINRSLSTPYTPDRLNEWLREQVELQGYWKQGADLAESDYFPIADFPHVDPTGCTPLYALKGLK